jgi:hypothetical protein
MDISIFLAGLTQRFFGLLRNLSSERIPIKSKDRIRKNNVKTPTPSGPEHYRQKKSDKANELN